MRALDRSSRRRVALEHNLHKKQQNELALLLVAAEQGLDWTALDAPLALGLAKAARDTLQAEEVAFKQRIVECQNLLATLKDSHDDARGRVDDAMYQVGSIMSVFDKEGLHIDLFQPSPPTRSLLIKYGIYDQPSDSEPLESFDSTHESTVDSGDSCNSANSCNSCDSDSGQEDSPP